MSPMRIEYELYFRRNRYDDSYVKSVVRNNKADVCPHSRGKKYPTAKRK